MNLQEKILKVWRRWSPELLIFAIFLGFGFWINRGVELKGLYMDDLYLWSCYGNQSFTEYVFPMGSSRFRFLFYLASWLELFFIGGHVEWMVPFNIILNTGIAYSIYRMAVSFSDGRRIISFAVGILYLSSRMAYYQIGQFYGLMESLALWAAVFRGQLHSRTVYGASSIVASGSSPRIWKGTGAGDCDSGDREK